MMKQQGIGTYLAQGWAANASLAYLLLLGFVLLNPSRDYWAIWLVVAPIYASTIGIVGGAVGLLIWLVEHLIKRKIKIVYRGAAAILFPVLVTTSAASTGALGDVIEFIWVSVALIALLLPPALLSGSRFNPLRFVLIDLDRDLPKGGWPRALSMIFVPLLRLTAALGILEALLYVATLRSGDLVGWNTGENAFVAAVVGVVYFWVTLIVALWPMERIVLILIGIILNAPVAAFALAAQWQSNVEYRSLAIFGWALVGIWIVFVVGQSKRSETRRIVPVTMLEIRIRHAFNYW